jgi:hypothetical protein
MRGLLGLLITIAGSAGAAGVYVNGINVEGLANQTFERVNVRLDDKGNVHIDAPGYLVKRLAGPEAPRPEAALARRYFLKTVPEAAANFDVGLSVNGRLVRTLSSSEPLLVEVTTELRRGKNSVLIKAKRRSGGKATPDRASKEDVFRIIIGEGWTKGDEVVIDNPLIDFSHRAVEEKDVAQEFTLVTR